MNHDTSDLGSIDSSFMKKYTEVYSKNPLNQSTDAFKSLEFIANENGFACEKYQVTTEDGYVLGIFRIPGKLGEVGKVGGNSKPPVLLQHGLESDMMQWIYNRPSVAPAFVLARAGYDVWLGNNRGNRWSQNHVSLDPSSKEFW